MNPFTLPNLLEKIAWRNPLKANSSQNPASAQAAKILKIYSSHVFDTENFRKNSCSAGGMGNHCSIYPVMS